jgi:uncharacterized membrane protein HdeD (DUF308 family)
MELDIMSFPLQSPVPTALFNHRESLRPYWWLLFGFGLVSVIAGSLAISSVFVATMASVAVFGVLLVVAGVTELLHAVMVRNLSGFAMHLIAAALYLFTGVFMLEDPIKAATVLTLFLSASFFVGGALRIVYSLAERFPAWPWVFFNGVVDLFLGTFIFREWPESSLWVIGLFVGIDLLLHGWSWVLLGLTVRTYAAPRAA